MIVKRSDMAWITVSDSSKEKKLFVDILGMKIQADAPEYGWMELVAKDGGSALGIGQYNPEYSKEVKPGQNAIVTFSVDDILAAKRVLEKNGVTLLGDIVEVPGHVKMLFFADGDGNKFQICQLLDEPSQHSSCC